MIQFGVLGAARIVPNALVDPCADEPRAAIHCIAARDVSRAERFAQAHSIPVVHSTYREVIGDPTIGAVYNPLPISLHHRWTLEALEAGKHVLCEKSFSSNAREAEEMAQAATESGRVLMDAFHYRYHPAFHRAREIVESGRLGRVDSVEATFHVPITNPTDIRLNYATGGGATMDIGCYAISWARHITGEEPSEVTAVAEVGPPHVDVFLEAHLKFPSGVCAVVSGDMRAGVSPRIELSVTGDEGKMVFQNPLAPQLGHRIELEIQGQKSVEELDRRSTYAYQLDAFIEAIQEGTPLLTGAEDAVKQMRVIDRCYEAAGLPVRGLNL